MQHWQNWQHWQARQLWQAWQHRLVPHSRLQQEEGEELAENLMRTKKDTK